MRPDLLNPLFAGAATLPGIGPKLEKALGKLLRPSAEPSQPGARVVDLLFHLPVAAIDRRDRPNIADLPQSGIVTVEVEVGRHRPPPSQNKRVPYRVDCFDHTGTLTLTFFHAYPDYIKKILPEGATRFVSGRIEHYQGAAQMVHPDHVVTAEEFATMPLLEPVYPLTAGVSTKVVGKAVRAAVAGCPVMPEWQDAAWLQRNRFPAFTQALKAINHPEHIHDLDQNSPARLRLAYDELLANQLALALVRRHMKQARGRSTGGSGELRAGVLGKLPYTLTGSQNTAIAQIAADMAAPERKMRLLQGDVGSGKTIVALAGLLCAAEAGAQGALMVPTDLLARQHFATLSQLVEPSGVGIDVLTGREKGSARERVLERLKTGETSILIGTHALFQEHVAFNDLALVVIDEQHRFGVHQRLALQAKSGSATDLLVMTATPIPRTLSLTLYGDMDVSRLTEKPAGRQPVDTRVLPVERLDDVIDGLERQIAEGARVYWVCPLVEDSDLVDLAAAEDRFAALCVRFPGRTGLVHGRMKGADKDDVMARFRTGDLDILVSTTVIEVGVDVPEATIMVVENAERFGLAQLHQLRGRIGRGLDKSTCLLLYDGHLGETARARLKVMRESDDGFKIADEDLRLRGAGELLGTRQSGVAAFRLANLIDHGDLLAAARDDVELVISRDAQLNGPRGAPLRCLLYLFERDEAVRLISAG